MSPGTALLFPRAVLEELEHGVCFLIPLRLNTWQPAQSSCEILSLGGSVYKGLGLKEVGILPPADSPFFGVRCTSFEMSLAKFKVLNLKIGF